MNGSIKKAMETAAQIKTDHPDDRGEYLEGIEQAKALREAAAAAKEQARTEAELDDACNEENRARDREKFFRRQLDRLDYTPRMDEAEYYKLVEGVEAEVESAAAVFRAKASKAIAEIIAAKEAYLEVTTNADAALIALDTAARVLQSKYRYRVVEFVDAPAQNVEDPTEWTRHVIRYASTGRELKLVAWTGTEWNDTICAAWTAADRAKGKH